MELAKWVAIGAPTYVVTMIRYGAFVPLLSIPPAFFVASPPIVGEQLQAWVKLRDHYLDTGAIRKLDTAPRHCCAAFLVPKKSGGYRLVVDLGPVNAYFPTMSVRYENLTWLRHVPRTVCMGASLDL